MLVMTFATVAGVTGIKASADGNQGRESVNVHDHDYTRWSHVSNSYMYFDGDNPVRVEAMTDKTLLIEKYSTDFKSIVFTKTIPFEMPLFGGFYAGKNALFAMFGQENYNESASLDVVRIVKYDYSWNKLGETNYRDINTTEPFCAGASSFSEYGNILYVHTCHQMNASSDGLRHQANLTFAINTDTMKSISSRSRVWNVNGGYVSHSFNQFIRNDGNNVITVDHGDAYPRSVVLIKYPDPVSSGLVDSGRNYVNVNLVDIPGGIGNNSTNVTTGGFEISDSSYITAITQVAYSSDANTYLRYNNPNVYLLVQPRNDFSSSSTKKVALTSYAEGSEEYASNPFLVKVNDNRFLVMWEKTDSSDNYGNKIYAVLVDGKGNTLTDTNVFDAELSDCQPVEKDGKVFWYTTGTQTPRTYYHTIFYDLEESAPRFYEIGIVESGNNIALKFSNNPNAINYKPDVEQVTKFVHRFYKVILNRTDEQIASDVCVQNWIDNLVMGENTGADVAKGFIFSDEFKKKGYNNKQFVETLYEAFFDRHAKDDPDGFDYWIDNLFAGASREYIVAGFVNSAEFKNLCKKYGINPGSLNEEGGKPTIPISFPPLNLDTSNVSDEQLTNYVKRLYEKALGRDAEPEGLENWKNVILTGKDAAGTSYDAGSVASRGFFKSDEYRGKNKSNEEFVADAYKTFFDRDPRGTAEQVYYEDWVNQLNEGKISKTMMIENGFGHSDEFKRLLISYGFVILE